MSEDEDGAAPTLTGATSVVAACTQYVGDMRLRPVPGVMPVCRACGGAFKEHDNPWGKPEACRACTLFKEPGPVPSTGPKDAKLAFLAEAPGAQEVDEEMGFRRQHFATLIGGSGRALTAMCAQAEIYRKETWGGNAVKCRPPLNRKPSDFEVAKCAQVFLIPELETINPNVMVPLGDTALSVTAGLKGITNNRGVPIEGYKRKDGTKQKLLPTWHPAFILRSQHLWPFIVHDLARAKAQSAFPELRRVPYVIVAGSGDAAVRGDLLARCRARRTATFDFETTGLSPRDSAIVMCGFTADGDKADVLDWSGLTAELLQTLLDDPEVKIIGQNVLYFDLPFAEGKGLNIDKAWGKVFDDMVAFHLCNASYGNTSVKQQAAGRSALRAPEKDLTMIASNHTDIPYWKSRDSYKADLRRVCGIDVIATHRAATDPTSGLMKELESYGMTDLYWKHVLPVHPVLHKMNKRGIRCDVPKASIWSSMLRQAAEKIESDIKIGLNQPDLNLRSSKQLMHLLYDVLKLPVQRTMDAKTRQLRPTADAVAIQNLAQIAPENAVLGGIVEMRHALNTDATFIQPGLRLGRYHPHVGTSKTANGRLNSWDPNGQNVPSDLRELWVADDDGEFGEECVLVVGDWSQIEWRVAMVLSGDPVGLEALAKGIDTHKNTFSQAFGVPIEKVTPVEREVAKFLVYGLSYGRQAESIVAATTLGRGDFGGAARAQATRTRAAAGDGLTLEQAQAFFEGFAKRYKAYWGFREDTIQFAAKHGYLVNAWGRRRWWHSRQVMDRNEQYAYQPASHAAEMMYDCLITLDAQLPKEVTLRLTVHDEILVNAPRSMAREAVKAMRSVMQSTWPKLENFSANRAEVHKHYPNGWFCPVDIHVAPNWEMAKTKHAGRKALRSAFEAELGVTDLVGEKI